MNIKFVWLELISFSGRSSIRKLFNKKKKKLFYMFAHFSQDVFKNTALHPAWCPAFIYPNLTHFLKVKQLRVSVLQLFHGALFLSPAAVG